MFIIIYIFNNQNGTTHVMFFVANGHPRTVSGVNLHRLHTGLQRVQLLKPDIPEPEAPDDMWTFEITAPKVHYHSFLFKSINSDFTYKTLEYHDLLTVPYSLDRMNDTRGQMTTPS